MGLFDKVTEVAKKSGLAEQEVDLKAQEEELQQFADSLWHWLRTALDEACDLYQHEGKDDHLRDVLAGQALEDVKAYLDQLRAQNMVWTYPAEQRNKFEIHVNDVIDDTYVFTEYFRDHSRVEVYRNGQLVETLPGDGAEKAVRATVVAEGESYRIIRLALVDAPNVA